MLSGVSKKDHKYLWLVLLWFLLSAGPGIEIFNRAQFLGPFPINYWYLVAAWIFSLVVMALLCYKADFCKVEKMEEKVKAIEKERLEKQGEEVTK